MKRTIKTPPLFISFLMQTNFLGDPQGEDGWDLKNGFAFPSFNLSIEKTSPKSKINVRMVKERSISLFWCRSYYFHLYLRVDQSLDIVCIARLKRHVVTGSKRTLTQHPTKWWVGPNRHQELRAWWARPQVARIPWRANRRNGSN